MANRPTPPSSWANCTVADITLPVGKVDPKFQPTRKIRYIDISGIDNQSNQIAATKSYKLSEAPSRARQIVKAGDVVFSTVRPYLRNIANVSEALDGEIASTGFAVLRPAEGIDPGFLFYKVTSQEFVDEISGKQYGASYPAVKDSQVRSISLSIPPLNEQHRIVEKIETLFARLDQGEAALRQVQTLLARYRQSVLKAAVTGQLTADWRTENAHRLEPGHDLLERILQTRRETWQGRGKYKEPTAPDTTNLPELPDGWVWAPLEGLCKPDKHALKAGPFGSALKKSDYSESGYKIYGQEQVIGGDWTIGDYYINEEKFQALQNCQVSPRDVLISLVGTIGKVLVLPPECALGIINPRLVKISLQENAFLPEFFKLYFESGFLKSLYKLDAHGATMDVLNLGIIKRLPYPLCSLEEQELIVERATEALDLAVSLETWCQTELTRSTALRQSILKQAFAGRLVPQDPNDEPASELLTRIPAQVDEKAAGRCKTRKRA
jgi:type I restriction enzyme, S subunit